MLQVRRARDRFHTRIGWLDSWHTFSFGEHHDPDFVGFRALRVINDDTVTPGQGFGRHSHRDMEIVSYVLDGALEHQDSLGSGEVLRPGEVQRMSAGTGVTHSEFNASKSEPVHFLQIWLQPERPGLPASYEQKRLPDAKGLAIIGAREPKDGAVKLHQDVTLYAGKLAAGETASVALAQGRHGWVHLARGALTVNGERLQTGDGAALSREASIELVATEPSEVLVFDLA